MLNFDGTTLKIHDEEMTHLAMGETLAERRFRTASALCSAAAKGNIRLLEALLKDSNANVNHGDYDKRTPLHLAVGERQFDTAAYLLKLGADREAQDRWGRSAVDYAFEAKDYKMLRLLEQSSPIQVSMKVAPISKLTRSYSATDRRFMQISARSTSVAAFFQAVADGDTAHVKRAWLDGLPLETKDIRGRTAIHVAVLNGQSAMVELLISAGINLDTVDASGQSPLSIALSKQLFPIADMLRKHKREVDAKESLQYPLAVVVKQLSQEDQLISAKAFYAVKRGDIEMVRQLIPSIVHPDVKDYGGRTPLHIAATTGQLGIATYLIESCFANVNALDSRDVTPLTDALDFAHHDVAKLLVSHKATESGHDSGPAVDQIDSETLATALEFALRSVTQDKWLLGQVHCPVKNERGGYVLVPHSLWCKNEEKINIISHNEDHYQMYAEQPTNEPHASTHLHQVEKNLRKFRKSETLMMIDPGQGHTGCVYLSQVPEWLSLHNAQQSHYFQLPMARRAGLQTILSIPMLCKLTTVAVLSWYSDEVSYENISEIKSIQRLLRSISLLAILRQDLVNSDSTDAQSGEIHVSRFQYCQILDSSITANGELTFKEHSRNDMTESSINEITTIPLALEWKLFDWVHQFATSMNSEDHVAVISLLRSIVLLLQTGYFREELEELGNSSDPLEASHIIENCQGSISTPTSLLIHVVYYLHFLSSVSPVEGSVFFDVYKVITELKAFGKLNSLFGTPATKQTRTSSVESNAEKKISCVLCRLKVSGHIHPGMDPIPSKVASPDPSSLATSCFFAVPSHPRSPIFRTIQKLRGIMFQEFDTFVRSHSDNQTILNAVSSAPSSILSSTFSASELFDAIGASHDSDLAPKTPRFASSTKGPHVNFRQQLLEAVNNVAQDTTALITFEHLMAIHKALVPHSNQAGALRTETAVGYASARIYRVFLPAGEIMLALKQLVDTLNDPANWNQRPALCAYYAFAVLVFYIHPFHDGNGRCARLLGNILSKKLGFAAVFRAADKTLQVPEFLQKIVVATEVDHVVPDRRQQRKRYGGKENASMWF